MPARLKGGPARFPAGLKSPMRKVVWGWVVLASLPLANAQTAMDIPALTATIARLTPEMGPQVGELYFKVHSAVLRRDAADLRASCEQRRNAFRVFEPLYSPEVTGFLTQANHDRHPQLFQQIVTLTQLSLDLGVVLNAVCGERPPSQAERLAAYAIISNAYALNRQMSASLAGANRENHTAVSCPP